MLSKFPALTLCNLKLSKANLPIATNAYKSGICSLVPLRSHLWAELSATWGHPAFTTWSSTPRSLQSCNCFPTKQKYLSLGFCFVFSLIAPSLTLRHDSALLDQRMMWMTNPPLISESPFLIMKHFSWLQILCFYFSYPEGEFSLKMKTNKQKAPLILPSNKVTLHLFHMSESWAHTILNVSPLGNASQWNS